MSVSNDMKITCFSFGLLFSNLLKAGPADGILNVTDDLWSEHLSRDVAEGLQFIHMHNVFPCKALFYHMVSLNQVRNGKKKYKQQSFGQSFKV